MASCFPPGDAAALAEAMRRLLDEPATRAAGRASRARAAAWTPAAGAAKWVEAFDGYYANEFAHSHRAA